ncbi:MAG: tetratricopeptide repeat protein [Pirellulales bacterium]|nr:tetratricopeptide repeat protein [Pirellulales bacterium]
MPGHARPWGLLLLMLTAGSASAGEKGQPHFPGLGPHTRPITTTSAEAQDYFDEGLAFLHAFNHDEAIRSFEAALEHDPRCAMAWWGVALANGPHINNPAMPPERSAAAWKAWQEANRYSPQGTPVERALIAALGKRYAATPPEDRRPLDEAYAAALREVWRQFPQDPDVGAFCAEAIMDLRPWDQWTPEGEAQPGTDETVALLERVLELSPHHPLALHLYIHAVEASPSPERAADVANRLRTVAPGLGHLVHMPSHIDVRLGNWDLAVTSNQRAIEADRHYRRLAGKQGFYHVYMAHNHHMLAFAATMRGQSKLALSAIQEMADGIPPEWVAESPLIADGFLAMPVELMIRFGRWDEVLAAPEPAENLPLSRALYHASRGVARAARGETELARAEQQAFLAAQQKIPAESTIGNNLGTHVASIAQHLLAGEILYREGNVEEGLAELREAIELEDQLRYDEPPSWIHPVRHALGATLLKEGRAAEAEAVYRADLKRYPDNGWALFGLAQSLSEQGQHEEAAEIDVRFRATWIDADVEITSSCFCQPSLARPKPAAR